MWLVAHYFYENLPQKELLKFDFVKKKIRALFVKTNHKFNLKFQMETCYYFSVWFLRRVGVLLHLMGIGR